MNTIAEKVSEKALAYVRNTQIRYSDESIARAYIAGWFEALQSQWRSVEDELPEIDDYVLVIFSRSCIPTYIEKAVAYYNGEEWYTQAGWHIQPTHWLPISEPPKDDKK